MLWPVLHPPLPSYGIPCPSSPLLGHGIPCDVNPVPNVHLGHGEAGGHHHHAGLRHLRF
jgi:hypothetical protein